MISMLSTGAKHPCRIRDKDHTRAQDSEFLSGQRKEKEQQQKFISNAQKKKKKKPFFL
jgi:hypothetical protein